MKVVVKYYTVMCVAAGYCREEQITLQGAHDVYSLLKLIAQKYGAQMQKNVNSFLRGDAAILWLFVNGCRIKDGYHLNLNDGDVIVLTTPLLVGG